MPTVLSDPVLAIDAMLDPRHPVKVAATEWAEQTLPSAVTESTSAVLDRTLWREAGKAGYLGALCPTEFGGSDRGAVHAALRFEGLGSSPADNGVVFAIAAQAFTVNRAIALAGSDEQKRTWLPQLTNGSLFASFTMTESGAGSDPWAIETTAAAQPDGTWKLNGAKHWATLAPIADVAVVFAKTAPDKGQWGISAFIVDLNQPGVSRGGRTELMGMAACPVGSLHFDDVTLGAESILANPGSGAAIFSTVVEAERAFLYAGLVGAAEHTLGLAVTHARTRNQGGAHIGSYQAVTHRLVDMLARHEAARLSLFKTAAQLDAGQSLTLSAALTKLASAEGCVESAVDALRTFGASGYGRDGGIEVQLRDALAGLSFSGTTDVTRNLVASFLNLHRPL